MRVHLLVAIETNNAKPAGSVADFSKLRVPEMYRTVLRRDRVASRPHDASRQQAPKDREAVSCYSQRKPRTVLVSREHDVRQHPFDLVAAAVGFGLLVV